MIVKDQVRQIPIMPEANREGFYNAMLEDVVKGQNFEMWAEIYLSFVATRYNLTSNFVATDIGSENRGYADINENIIKLNNKYTENVNSLEDFLTLVKCMEHELGHLQDFRDKGVFSIDKNRNGRICEADLGKVFAELSGEKFSYLNISPEWKKRIESFGKAIYALGDEEVYAREQALHYTNQFILDLKEKDKPENAEKWNKYIDANIADEKRIKTQSIESIRADKEYMQVLYNNLVEEAVKDSANVDAMLVSKLTILQDSKYFYSKQSYDKLMKFARQNNLFASLLNLADSKFADITMQQRMKIYKEAIPELKKQGQEKLHLLLGNVSAEARQEVFDFRTLK